MKNKEYYHTNILRKYVRKLEVKFVYQVNLPVDERAREFLINIRKRFRAWSMGSLYYSGFGFHSSYIGAQLGLQEILPYRIT